MPPTKTKTPGRRKESAALSPQSRILMSNYSFIFLKSKYSCSFCFPKLWDKDECCKQPPKKEFWCHFLEERVVLLFRFCTKDVLKKTNKPPPLYSVIQSSELLFYAGSSVLLYLGRPTVVLPFTVIAVFLFIPSCFSCLFSFCSVVYLSIFCFLCSTLSFYLSDVCNTLLFHLTLL